MWSNYAKNSEKWETMTNFRNVAKQTGIMRHITTKTSWHSPHAQETSRNYRQSAINDVKQQWLVSPKRTHPRTSEWRLTIIEAANWIQERKSPENLLRCRWRKANVLTESKMKNWHTYQSHTPPKHPLNYLKKEEIPKGLLRQENYITAGPLASELTLHYSENNLGQRAS